MGGIYSEWWNWEPHIDIPLIQHEELSKKQPKSWAVGHRGFRECARKSPSRGEFHFSLSGKGVSHELFSYGCAHLSAGTD